MANKLKSITSVTADSPSSVASSKTMSAEDKLRERKWKAEDALRCLTRANEMIKDKQLMADVKELAREQMKGLQSIGRR